MKFFKKILLVLLIIVSLFIFLELLAKVANYTFFKNKIDPQTLRTEFEEIYIPPFAQKEPDEFRIFVYGGSTVKGIPLPKVGFVPQMQYQLNHVFEGKDVKVFNFGWAGYNSTRIRYFFERTISQKPDLIIIYTGENEFIYPQLDYYWLVKATTAIKNRSNLAKMIVFVAKNYDPSHDDKLHSRYNKFPAYAANKIFTWAKMRLFKTNIREIVKEAKARRVPIILGIPASNIKDWPPVKRELTTLNVPDDYKETLQKSLQLIDEKQLSKANNLINDSLSKFNNDASLLYIQATIAAKGGQNAQELFEKAKDADLVPWRTTTAYANFLKSLDDKKIIWTVDFARIFAQNSPDNVTGFNFILDNTHTTKEGAYLLSKSIIDFIKKEKLINKKWLKDSKESYPMTDLFKEMNISEEDDFLVYLGTAGYALSMPFLNIETAKFYIEKAENINSQNWETKALKASVANLEGDSQLATAYLKEAEKLKGSAIKKEETNHIPYLFEILSN